MTSYHEGPDEADAAMSRDPSSAPTATYAASPQQQQQPGVQQPGFGFHPGSMPPYAYGGHWEMRPRRVYPIETKPFFLTSEFVAAVLAVVGIAITAAASDDFGAWRAWILISAVVVGYMVSRGIAKSGTRSHADDPRENLDLNWGRSGDRS